MYEYNGYVYGNDDGPTIEVKEVRTLEEQIMLITFSNGETRLFDASILKGPVFEALKDEKTFQACSVEFGVVTWDNGNIDCAPEFMYSHSYEYKKVV